MKRTVACGLLCVWTVQAGILTGAPAILSRAAAGDPVTAIAVTPDGDGVVTGSHAGLFLRSGPQFRNVQQLPTELESIHDLRFTSDGKRLAVAGGTPGQFGLTEILEWPAARVAARIREHDDVIYAVSWSSSGQWISTASLDSVCLICDSATGIPLCRLEGHSKGVTGIEWLTEAPQTEAESASLLLTCSLDETLRVWSLAMDSSQQLPRLVRTMNQHTGAVTGIVRQPHVPDSARRAVASWGDDKTVRFWQPENGRLLRFARLPNPVTSAVWSADGNELFAAMDSGVVVRIEFGTAGIHELCRTEPPAAALVLHPDLSHLISGDVTGVCSTIDTRARIP